jgi:lysophospholipase L1-like esterase
MDRRLSVSRRGALVLFGLSLSLLIIEVILQIGGLVHRFTGRPQPVAWLTGRRRVMCVGDSNVYGLWVRREETFPRVLERIWNAATPDAPVEVLNFGMPGLNSSKLRRSFRGLLDTFHPDVVLALVGSNDINSIPVPIGEESDSEDRAEYMLWRNSRAFRLLYMIVSRLTEPPTEVEYNYRLPRRRGVVRSGEQEFDLAGTDRAAVPIPEWNRKLAENLRAMAQDSQAVGATFVALTYASGQSLYGTANRVIRSMQRQLPVIDPTARFAWLCPGPCADLFFGDQHPNADGYQLYSAIVWQGLDRLGIADAVDGEGRAFSVLSPLVRGKLELLGRIATEEQSVMN